MSKRQYFRSPEESFAARAAPNGGCLEWSGSRSGKGYGQIWVSGKMVYAHRYAWERENGPIPAGMLVDHMCWNHACVNVEHLRLATTAENTRYQEAVWSSTGIKNVTENKGRYYVNVIKDKQRHFGGGYDTVEEAARAAESLRTELFGEFAGRHSTVQAIEGALNDD